MLGFLISTMFSRRLTFNNPIWARSSAFLPTHPWQSRLLYTTTATLLRRPAKMPSVVPIFYNWFLSVSSTPRPPQSCHMVVIFKNSLAHQGSGRNVMSMSWSFAQDFWLARKYRACVPRFPGDKPHTQVLLSLIRGSLMLHKELGHHRAAKSLGKLCKVH